MPGCRRRELSRQSCLGVRWPDRIDELVRKLDAPDADGDGQPDSRVLDEPYLDPNVISSTCGGDFEPVSVPADHVFVMGDNRSGSQDSRVLGPIAEDDLVGRAFVVFWPRSDWRWL